MNTYTNEYWKKPFPISAVALLKLSTKRSNKLGNFDGLSSSDSSPPSFFVEQFFDGVTGVFGITDRSN